MTPAEAAEILELSPHASPAERAAQLDTLRRQLEDKLAKAPTPGLREKYRASLKQLEEAAAVLAQNDDSATLPVLQKESGARSREPGIRPTQTAASPASPSTPDSRPSTAAAKKSGSKEFLLVAAIAVAVLGAGGWWVMKTKAENEEKARVAAVEKARAEAEAAARKKAEDEEKARLEQIRVQLRTVIAEAKIAWEIAERTERDADRRLSELRMELRSLRDPQPAVAAALNRRIDSAQRYSNWLRDYVLGHPLKVARAKLEEIVQAGAVKDAETDGAEVRQLTQSLRADLAAHANGEGSLELRSNLPNVRWTLRNPADGEKRTGVGPGRIDGLLFERYELTLTGAPFDDEQRTLQLLPGQPGIVEVNYDFERLRFTHLTADTRLSILDPSGFRPWHPLPDGSHAMRRSANQAFSASRPGYLSTGAMVGTGQATEIALAWVPLQAPAVLESALAAWRGKPEEGGLPPTTRASLLPRLLQAADRSGLQTPAERAALLQEMLAELDFGKITAAPDRTEAMRRDFLRARLPLLAELQWSDPIAARLAYGHFVRDLGQLGAATRFQISTGNHFFPGAPEAMQDYLGLIRPLLTADRTDGSAAAPLGIAADVYGYLHLTDPGEAERLRGEILARRESSDRAEAERTLEQARVRSLAQRELAPLIRALVSRNYTEFNRLAEPGLGEQAAWHSGWLILRLLDQGFERPAADLAVSVNGSWANTFFTHARRTGRTDALEDLLARNRSDSNLDRLDCAELFALAGNRTKARLWLDKTDPALDREQRLGVLALLGESAGVRALFAELDKQGISFRDQSDRDLRLPQLVMAARAIQDADRERRLLELAGLREAKIGAEMLLAFGDREGGLRELLRNGPVPAMPSSFARERIYQIFHQRPDLRDDIPFFNHPGWIFDLRLSHLLRLNGALGPASARLTSPVQLATKPAVKKSTVFYFPSSQVSLGVKTGQATLLVNIDASGKPTGFTTLAASHPDFASELNKSVAQWEFHPALARGRPVAGTIEISRDFRLRE